MLRKLLGQVCTLFRHCKAIQGTNLQRFFSTMDACSFSDVRKFQVKHCALELKVNFIAKTLSGFADLQVATPRLENEPFVIDTRDLTISAVKCGDESVKYELGEPHPVFGAKLDIKVPSYSPGSDINVRIFYETSPQSTALQWLTPEQTAGKKHPYLYSQCQAIHARSLIPCQDTPAVKMTYSAKISVPKELVALMSAVKLDASPDPSDPDYVINKFEQKVPIPSYLMAVVVGSLEYRVIGRRSKVWSEKETLEAAAYEFDETEQMLSTAEKLLGPYVWGDYDLLVLPPTFPYGGMENPCLTFVTPTLLAGDRSLTLVVAHEIAHSWTGNLVTNRNHAHFWLNEGHTVFAERKIAGRLHGEEFRHFQAYGGFRELQSTINGFGADHPYNALVLDIEGGVDPDDAFSRIPYEKGSAFLMYLEQKLGGPEVFEPFLRAYIEKFKYTSITTDDWRTFLYQFFSEKKNILDEVDWDGWLYGRSTCPAQPVFDMKLVDSVSKLSKKWIGSSDNDLTQFSPVDVQEFSSSLLDEFLRQLLESENMTAGKVAKMDSLYKLSDVKNSEIRFRWLRLGIKTRVSSFIPKTLAFVNEQGRMKFVRPLYREMYLWEEARPVAIDNFQKQKASMHSTTTKGVSKDLHLT